MNFFYVRFLADETNHLFHGIYCEPLVCSTISVFSWRYEQGVIVVLLKNKKITNIIPVSNIINDSGYNLSSSPDGHWLLLYSTHLDQNEFLFYNLDSDRLYQSDYILEKDIRFQDWDFDSKYVIFSSNSNKSIYRIYLPSLWFKLSPPPHIASSSSRQIPPPAPTNGVLWEKAEC